MATEADDSEEPEREEPEQEEPERELIVYGRGVRTALRNNATAYGFSISITAAYGLASGSHGSATALQTVLFAGGAALAFVVVGAVFVTLTPRGSLPETGQITTISGGVDVVTVAAAVAAAFGLSRLPEFAAWLFTGFGAVIAYLLVGGLDVVLARWAARYTSFGRSQ